MKLINLLIIIFLCVFVFSCKETNTKQLDDILNETAKNSIESNSINSLREKETKNNYTINPINEKKFYLSAKNITSDLYIFFNALKSNSSIDDLDLLSESVELISFLNKQKKLNNNIIYKESWTSFFKLSKMINEFIIYLKDKENIEGELDKKLSSSIIHKLDDILLQVEHIQELIQKEN